MVLIVLVSLAPIFGADAPPLTNVDVVRMATSGKAEKDIIRTILEAPAIAFDLDPEVLEEMRAVGVTGPVIDAMKKAQKKFAPAAPVEAPPQPAPAHLELTFEGDPNADAMTRTAVFFAADPNTKQAFELAFFVVCTEPTHVPDFWKTRSPVGGAIPRHAMIWFHEGEVPYETKRGPRGMQYIALDLPRTVTMDVTDSPAPGETVHTLSIGVIAQEGKEEAMLLSVASTPLKTTPGETSRMTLAVSTKDAGILKRPQRDTMPHEIKVVSVDPDPNTPAEKPPTP